MIYFDQFISFDLLQDFASVHADVKLNFFLFLLNEFLIQYNTLIKFKDRLCKKKSPKLGNNESRFSDLPKERRSVGPSKSLDSILYSGQIQNV